MLSTKHSSKGNIDVNSLAGMTALCDGTLKPQVIEMFMSKFVSFGNNLFLFLGFGASELSANE